MKKLLLALLLILVTPLCIAQAETEDTSIREIMENEEAMAEAIEQRSKEGEALDMSTPLSSLLLLKQALDDEDYQRAGEFLDMRYLPAELEGMEAGELLRQLRYVWSRQEILDIALISDHPEGHSEDGLPAYRDQIGSIELSSGSVPIYMQRVPDGKGGRVWKVSNATVARIPEMWDELGYSLVAQFVSEQLPVFRLFGMENWQLVFFGLALVLAWPAATLVCMLLAKLLVNRRGPFMDAITRFLKFQFRIFLYIILVRFCVLHIGLTVYSTAVIQSMGLIYVAVIIFLLGVINLAHGFQARRLMEAGNEHYVALLRPVSTVVKVLVTIVVLLIWADDAGYDMSTVLAGLGVGSLAVALAAQKTLENIIGAITIYTAKPIKPGDFCRFGTTVGTVEEIGLRSTIIRTLNRTLVSIPNAVFAGDEVENYSERDRIRYFRYLRLEIGTAEQLRAVLTGLRELFESHDMVQGDTVSIRFDEITDNTAHVRVDAGIMTDDFQVYLQAAEELNLDIIDRVHATGARFSGPGQQLTVRSAGAEDPDALERFLAAQQKLGSE